MILLMVLPGRNAKRFRSKTANLLLQFFAGDERLVAEIRANGRCNGLLQEMAREELASGGAAAESAVVEEDECKRRMAMIEVLNAEGVASRRRMRLESEARIAVQAKENDAAIAARCKAAASELKAKRDAVDVESKAAAAKLKAQRDADEAALATRCKAAAAERDADSKAAAAKLKAQRDADDAALAARCKAAAAELKAQRDADEAALAARLKAAAAERDAEDQASLAKRRRLDEEASAERLRLIALGDLDFQKDKKRLAMASGERLTTVGETLRDLASTLRGLNMPEDVVSTEVAQHYVRLKRYADEGAPPPPAAAAQGGAPAAAAPPVAAQQQQAGDFTVRSFVMHLGLLRRVPAGRHEQLFKKIGTKLATACAQHGIVIGPKVMEGSYSVHSYGPAASGLAREVADEVVREEVAGNAQPDIRVAFQTTGSS